MKNDNSNYDSMPHKVRILTLQQLQCCTILAHHPDITATKLSTLYNSIYSDQATHNAIFNSITRLAQNEVLIKDSIETKIPPFDQPRMQYLWRLSEQGQIVFARSQNTCLEMLTLSAGGPPCSQAQLPLNAGLLCLTGLEKTRI